MSLAYRRENQRVGAHSESDTQPDNQTVLNKWKQKYGDDVDESTLEIEPLKEMDADKLRAGGLEVSKI